MIVDQSEQIPESSGVKNAKQIPKLSGHTTNDVGKNEQLPSTKGAKLGYRNIKIRAINDPSNGNRQTKGGEHRIPQNGGAGQYKNDHLPQN